MMNNQLTLRNMLLGALLLATCASVMAEGVVVVSAKSAVKSLTVDQAADIFMGRSSELTPLDQAEGSGLRDEFYQKVVGKNATQLKAYWSKQIFSGKGQPPKSAPDGAAVKTLLANDPTLIGYIDKAAADGSVRVLLPIK